MGRAAGKVARVKIENTSEIQATHVPRARARPESLVPNPEPDPDPDQVSTYLPTFLYLPCPGPGTRSGPVTLA